MIDYFEQDEEMSFIAASVFDDEHFGGAITEEELDYRDSLIEEYKDEIAFVKAVITNNPDFEALDYKAKINFVANMLVKLKERRTDTDQIKL